MNFSILFYPEIFYNSNCAGLSLTFSGNALQHGDHLLITDVGTSSENGLVCSPDVYSFRRVVWYHQLTEASFLDNDLEEKGWSTTRERRSFREMLSLFRTPGSKAKEGIFTCVTREGSISVNIHHPSEFLCLLKNKQCLKLNFQLSFSYFPKMVSKTALYPQTIQ